jgi:hypothetical protein
MSEMSPTARTAAPRRERLVAKGRVIRWGRLSGLGSRQTRPYAVTVD